MTIDGADTTWALVSTSLVFLMIPGLGYFYSGMSRSKHALSILFTSLLGVAVVSITWFLWAFSLAFSTTGGPFIGDLQYSAFFVPDTSLLTATSAHPSAATIPFGVFAIFQCMFAGVAANLGLGAVAERFRILPMLAFFFIWTTLVYSPIAYWTWAPNGWLLVLGTLDSAGGLPVHVASACSSLAKTLVVGKRVGHGVEEFKPNSYANIMLGTSFLWFGWFGFNAGSLGAGARAALAMIVTHLAACSGGLTWMLLAYFRDPKRKLSSFHFCCGAVAGLVACTPASSFVRPWGGVILGIISGALCHYAVDLKNALCYDDALDVFAVHGVGGIIGNLLVGVLASKDVAALSGTVIEGGVIDGHWMQLVYQLVATVAVCAWSFVVTFVIVWCMERVSWLTLRLSPQDELAGMDLSQMNENGFEHALEDFKRQQSIAHSVISEEAAVFTM